MQKSVHIGVSDDTSIDDNRVRIADMASTNTSPSDNQPLPQPPPSATVIKRNNNQLHLKSFAGGEGRWSVEENSLIPDEDTPLVNGQTYHHNIEPGCDDTAAAASAINMESSANGQTGLNKESSNHYSSGQLHRNIQNGSCQVKSLSNITSSDNHSNYINSYDNDKHSQLQNSLSNGTTEPTSESPYERNVTVEECKVNNKCKINNNTCPDKPTPYKDGMDEYFKQCGGGGGGETRATEKQTKQVTTITTATVTGGTTREVRPYNTDLNLLNCDDYEDEDGCIYFYNEAAGFEDNLLEHMLNTCVNCGLPNLDVPSSPAAADQLRDNLLYQQPLQPPPPPVLDNNVPVNNLFSPDMDFLEMDFDPNDLESSDCDDNCYPDVKMLTKSGVSDINGRLMLNNESSNNLSPERRTLMLCRRCENDSNLAGKVGNLCLEDSSSITSPFRNYCNGESNGRSPFALNLSNSVLDDRPVTVVSSRSGAIAKNIDNYRDNTYSSRDTYNDDASMNNSSVILTTPLALTKRQSDTSSGNEKLRPERLSDEVAKLTREDSLENNLERDDEGGEEADDEREDNSPTRRTTNGMNHLYSTTATNKNFNIQTSNTCPNAGSGAATVSCPPLVEPAAAAVVRHSIRVSSDITVMATPDKILICNTGSRNRYSDSDVTRAGGGLLTSNGNCIGTSNGITGNYGNSCGNKELQAMQLDNILKNNMNKHTSATANDAITTKSLCPSINDTQQLPISARNTNNNNNLGSLSAPEVSPAHEYYRYPPPPPPASLSSAPYQDRFKRSVSFHNQLSSPKYDNVCFVPHTNNLVPQEEDTASGSGSHSTAGRSAAAALTLGHSRNITSHESNVAAINSSYLKTHRHSHPCNEHDRHLWHNATESLTNQQGNSSFRLEGILCNNTAMLTDLNKANVFNNHSMTTAIINNNNNNSERSNINSDNNALKLGSNNSGHYTSTINNTNHSFNGNNTSSCGGSRYSNNNTIGISDTSNSSSSSVHHHGGAELLNITSHGTPAALVTSQQPCSPSDPSDRLSELVVKGSLPPKNSDPSIDINTTPALDSSGGVSGVSCPRMQEKVMVWTERQAAAKQASQTNRSACGISAIANVLLALEQDPVPSVPLTPHQRAEGAPLVQYLESRACAGTTHAELMQGIGEATQGSVVAKFFPMFPKRAVQLSRWLAGWIRKGGVCVCTLNLQCGVSPGEAIPDAWHHQMVFGVGPQGVYLTNPIECVCEEVLSRQLCSERVLLVRRQDVVRHWHTQQSLLPLLTQQDTRWRDMNVIGQVSLVLKEQLSAYLRRGTQRGRQHLTAHVAIPAAYQSGITVYMRKDNEHAPGLLRAEDLLLLE